MKAFILCVYVTVITKGFASINSEAADPDFDREKRQLRPNAPLQANGPLMSNSLLRPNNFVGNGLIGNRFQPGFNTGFGNRLQPGLNTGLGNRLQAGGLNRFGGNGLMQPGGFGLRQPGRIGNGFLQPGLGNGFAQQGLGNGFMQPGLGNGLGRQPGFLGNQFMAQLRPIGPG